MAPFLSCADATGELCAECGPVSRGSFPAGNTLQTAHSLQAWQGRFLSTNCGDKADCSTLCIPPSQSPAQLLQEIHSQYLTMILPDIPFQQLRKIVGLNSPLRGCSSQGNICNIMRTVTLLQKRQVGMGLLLAQHEFPCFHLRQHPSVPQPLKAPKHGRSPNAWSPSTILLYSSSFLNLGIPAPSC